ncbi:HEAT repeat domain-containing protein [Bacillus massiliigorillae]|uniref:HEAT repeat domain-containing protein n=1 Tax=Bacillus massiliigorillae TaxID=1243664 RepID=UPI000399E600|nr:HEAT repeat domain-containing protein [Bacillus massiliigorillae]
MVLIDISIELLLIIIFVFSIILVSLYAYLSCKHIKYTSQQNKKKKYIEKKQHEWYQYLKNETDFPITLIPKKDFEIQGIEEIFLTYVRNFTDSTVQNKIKQFSNEYLTNYYTKLLKSRSWSHRMIALYRIADFHMDHLIEECYKLEKRKLSKEERFQLLKIYALFAPKIFLKKLAEVDNLSDYELKKLLLNNDDWIMQKLIEQQNILDLDKQYSLIDSIGLKRNLDFLPFLESLLEHENLEIRIRSLKAIYEIGIITDPHKYLRFVKSPNWEERLMAGKLFEHFPLKQARPYLEEMVHDQSWWVRYQAANTIMNNKGGKEILQNIIITSTDQYAIDIAKEVLNR